MANSDHSDATKFWDKNARKYAKEKIADQAEYENGLEITKTFLRSEHHVLELGCGTGSTALLLAPFVGRITGSDISPEMIAICNEKKAAADINNVQFIVGATTQPELPNGHFDAVLAFSMLHLVGDLDETLAQIHQRLKPGGMFISKTPCLSQTRVFSLMRWPLILAQKLGQAPKVIFFNVAQLELRVKKAGFELVHGYTTEKQPRRRYIAAKKKV